MASKKVRKHPRSRSEGSKAWIAEQQWNRDRLHYEAEDEKMADAKQRALELFRTGDFLLMGDAAWAAAEEAELLGDEEIGEVADLFATLEAEGDADSLWEWQRPAAKQKVPDKPNPP